MIQLIKSLFIIALLSIGAIAVHAQETDYMKHGKTFKICSIKRECSECYSCPRQRLLLHMQNNTDKRIVAVYYKYHSSLYNRDIRKEAKLETPIEKHNSGILHVCVNDKQHWRISGIAYADGSTEGFTLATPLENFKQDADEDCNLSY